MYLTKSIFQCYFSKIVLAKRFKASPFGGFNQLSGFRLVAIPDQRRVDSEKFQIKLVVDPSFLINKRRNQEDGNQIEIPMNIWRKYFQ